MNNMSKVIMYKGLPGSGKSTEAKKLVAESKGKIKRVNKDDLRAMIDAGEWSGKNERFILQIRDEIVRQCIVNHVDIIVDDTNFAPEHETRLRQLAETWKATFEINDSFCFVPIEECIARDLKRPNSVGERVIRGMHKQYLEPKVEKVEYVEGLPTVVLVDCDGTIALSPHRSPYDFSKVSGDIRNEPVARLVDYLTEQYKIIFVSGRDETCRKETEQWIKDNMNWNIEGIELYMRPAGNKEKDVLIKKRIYEDKIKGKYNVWIVIDDRKQVVDGWRALGLTCLQCAEGLF